MILLTEKEQLETLECGYTSKDRWNKPSTNYYQALKKNRLYPKCDNLYKKWSYFCEHHDKTKELITEEYCILREVDEEAYHTLYSELFNPVSLKYYLGVKDGKHVHSFVIFIDSIDDSAYRFYFDNVTPEDVERLRPLFIEYIENNKIINISEFTKFCLDLGATDESY